MAAILVLHGPNLNLLGTREPEIYGSETLDEINHRLQSEAERAGASLTCLQSNSEQEMIEAIHQARADGTQFIIINPAAFTHTSVALRDALAVSIFHASRCTFPTYTPANLFGITVISRTSLRR